MFVITDRKSNLEKFCNFNKIKYYQINYSKDKEKELLEILDEIKADLIITTWHKILGKEIVKKYEKMLINLHYSLLSSFSGMIGIKPIERAIQKKVKFLGATVHFVNENVDDGEIISQGIILNKVYQNIEEKINIIFRMGCVILTDSILNILDLNYEKNKLYNNHNKIGMINPEIKIKIEIIDEMFWENLKS